MRNGAGGHPGERGFVRFERAVHRDRGLDIGGAGGARFAHGQRFDRGGDRIGLAVEISLEGQCSRAHRCGGAVVTLAPDAPGVGDRILDGLQLQLRPWIPVRAPDAAQ
jgi:hypothetical protein